MKLITKEIEAAFAKQGDCSDKPATEIKVIAKFFNPAGAGTWFATEMWYNITTEVANNEIPIQPTQVQGLQEHLQVEKINSVQDMCKSSDCKNKEDGLCMASRKEEPSVQGSADGQRICNDLDTGTSKSKKKLRSKSNLKDGKKDRKIADGERNGSSQGREQIERSVIESEVDDQNKTSFVSYVKDKQQTMDVNASEIKNYPGCKVNRITFFGYVNLIGKDCAELGYFSLDELESFKGRFGLGIERDLHFGMEHTLQEVMDKY